MRTMNTLCLVQLFGLWNSVIMSKEGRSRSFTKGSAVVFAVQYYWVQSTIAVCSDYFVADNMVYMGTVNNNSMC